MARTAFGRQVDIFNSNLQGEGRRQLLIATARTQFAAALQQNREILGRDPAVETIVDGRSGASISEVKAGGTIVYLFDVGAQTLRQAVDEAFQILTELSPVLKGTYQRSFRLFVNDIERDAGLEGEVIDLAETDKVAITNLVPYGRKIERGWSNQAPNGVVEAAVATLRGRYGRLLTIGFSYDRYPGHEIGVGRRGARLNRHTREGRTDWQRAARYPTMTIEVK